MEVKNQLIDGWVNLGNGHEGVNDSISDLPEELIQQIFSCLSLEDRLSSRSVSRNWNNALLRESSYQEINKIKKMIKHLTSFLNITKENADLVCEFESLNSKMKEEFNGFKDLKENSLLVQKLILSKCDTIDLLIEIIKYFKENKPPLFNEVLKELEDIGSDIHLVASLKKDYDIRSEYNLPFIINKLYESLKKNYLNDVAEKFLDFNIGYINESEVNVNRFRHEMNNQRFDNALEALSLISPRNKNKDAYKKELVSKFLEIEEKEKAKNLALTIIDEAERTNALNLVKNGISFSLKKSYNIS